MIVALVVAAGFVVLLIAPTIHRRINENSRQAREDSRVSRAETLRSSWNGSVLSFDNASRAAKLRDRLLLSGVRTELISEGSQTLVVYDRRNEATVHRVLDDLNS